MGRSFSRDFGADTTKIIFNEAAIQIMGLEEPIGQTIRLWDEYDMEVVGVIKDFHFQSLHEHVNPLFMRLTPDETWNVMARVEANQEKETINQIKNTYQQFNPGFTFDFKFMDDDYASLYQAEQRVSALSKYFAAMAILISCLGLFGLAIFTTERRMKEIGIRKILGSSSFNIISLLTNDFSKMVIMAIVIAIPTSYFLIKNWLAQFAYKIDLSIWIFLLAAFVSLLIAWLTVSIQAFKAANVHPASCLRD
jgi:ABC-type antimicrobial peptide transport system permease subunit